MNDIFKILNSYKKNWYWFVIAIAVSISVAIFVYFKTPPAFRVDTTLLIRSFDKSEKVNKEFDLMGYDRRKDPEDELTLLKSRDMMKMVVNELNISTRVEQKVGLGWVDVYPDHNLKAVVENPETDVLILLKVSNEDKYVVKIKTGIFSYEKAELSSLSQPFQTRFGSVCLSAVAPLSVGAEYRIRIMPLAVAATTYQDNINMVRERNSQIISLSTETTCPAKEVDILNLLVEKYNIVSSNDRRTLAENTNLFIDERMICVAHELDSVEQCVEVYKSQNKLSDFRTSGNYYMEATNQYSDSISSVEYQASMVRYLYEFVTNPELTDRLIPTILGTSDNTLNALIRQYNTKMIRRSEILYSSNEQNPVLSKLDSELAKLHQQVIDVLQTMGESLSVKLSSLKKTEQNYSTRLSMLPEKERRYMEITREQQNLEKIYIFLNEKREENAIIASSTTIPALVVDKAERSANPVSPRFFKTMILAFIIGFLIPAVIFYFLDMKQELFPKLSNQEQQVRDWGTQWN